MKLKTIEIDGKVYAEVKDGKPVYSTDNGDTAYDVPGMAAKISAMTSEAAATAKAKNEAVEKLKAYEGIDDPEAARKALSVVANLDDKKLVDAGEVERVKAAAIQAVKEQYAPFEAKAKELEAALRSEKIGGSFARSKYIADNLAVPAPMVEASFGRHFEIADGKIIAKDGNGNPIYSRSNPGEIASFDEALEALVSASPYRDQIFKGRGQSGSGATGGDGGSAASIGRAEFDRIAKSDPTRARKMILDEKIRVID